MTDALCTLDGTRTACFPARSVWVRHGLAGSLLPRPRPRCWGFIIAADKADAVSGWRAVGLGSKMPSKRVPMYLFRARAPVMEHGVHAILAVVTYLMVECVFSRPRMDATEFSSSPILVAVPRGTPVRMQARPPQPTTTHLWPHRSQSCQPRARPSHSASAQWRSSHGQVYPFHPRGRNV